MVTKNNFTHWVSGALGREHKETNAKPRITQFFPFRSAFAKIRQDVIELTK